MVLSNTSIYCFIAAYFTSLDDMTSTVHCCHEAVCLEGAILDKVGAMTQCEHKNVKIWDVLLAFLWRTIGDS